MQLNRKAENKEKLIVYKKSLSEACWNNQQLCITASIQPSLKEKERQQESEAVRPQLKVGWRPAVLFSEAACFHHSKMVGPENALPHYALAAKKLPFAMVVTKLINWVAKWKQYLDFDNCINYQGKKRSEKRIFFLGVTVNWFVRVWRRQAIAAVLWS